MCWECWQYDFLQGGAVAGVQMQLLLHLNSCYLLTSNSTRHVDLHVIFRPIISVIAHYRSSSQFLSLLTFFQALSTSCSLPPLVLYFVNPILFPWRWCVSVHSYSPQFQRLKCVCWTTRNFRFYHASFFPSSFPCCPISTTPQCFPACLFTHSLLPSCLSDIFLVITSHTLHVWTQIIRVEWLGWDQQWHSPSNLSSDRWCFALPLRHLKNRSSAPLLSPPFCFTASLPCLLLCLISPVFPDFHVTKAPLPFTHSWQNTIRAVFLSGNVLFCLLFVCFILKLLPHFSNEYWLIWFDLIDLIWLQQLFLQGNGSLPFHSCTTQHLGCTPLQCPHPAVNKHSFQQLASQQTYEVFSGSLICADVICC